MSCALIMALIASQGTLSCKMPMAISSTSTAARRCPCAVAASQKTSRCVMVRTAGRLIRLWRHVNSLHRPHQPSCVVQGESFLTTWKALTLSSSHHDTTAVTMPEVGPGRYGRPEGCMPLDLFIFLQVPTKRPYFAAGFAIVADRRVLPFDLAKVERHTF